jgi:large subunit ribosomal protein L35
MPKMKTHSGAKKRFRLTGTGKVRHFHANHSHLLRKKSRRRKLILRQGDIVSQADEKRILRMLCK